jgi:hypothetical protein
MNLNLKTYLNQTVEPLQIVHTLNKIKSVTHIEL